jgi:hypothetical protein
MTALGAVMPRVIDVDLRTSYDQLMALPDFERMQLIFARQLGLPAADAGRVLVIDHSANLTVHADAFDMIARSPTTVAMLCVVVGPPTPLAVDRRARLPEPDADADAGGQRGAAGRPRRVGRGTRAVHADDDWSSDPADTEWEAEGWQSELPRASWQADGWDTGGWDETAWRQPGGSASGSDADPGPGPGPGRSAPDAGRRGSGAGAGGGVGSGSAAGAGGTHRRGRGREVYRGLLDDDLADNLDYDEFYETGAGPDGAGTDGARRDATGRDGTGPGSAGRDGRATRARTAPTGPPARETASGPLGLTKPFVLRETPTLWVCDARGVGWAMGGAQPASLNTVGDDPLDAAPLSTLIDALRQPALFDKLVEQIAAMPSATAAPGLHAVLGRVEDGLLDDALRQAIDTAVSPSADFDPSALPPPHLVAEPLGLLLGISTSRFADAAPLRSDGQVSTAVRACRDRVTDAKADALGLPRPRTLLLSPNAAYAVGGQLRDVAEDLADLRGNIADQFTGYDGRRTDPTRRRALESLGVDLTPPRGADPAAVGRALRNLAETALLEGHPVADVTGWFDDLADRVEPSGSAVYVDELRTRCCPDTLLDQLDAPSRISLSLAAPGALIPAALGCLLAQMWRPAHGVTAALAAIAIGLVTLAVVTATGWRLASARITGPDDSGRLDLLALVGAGVVGAVGGWYVAKRLTPPDPVALALLAIGGVTLLAWPLVVWQHAAARWQAGFDDALDALDRTASLVSRVALAEWVLGDLRHLTRQFAQSTASALRAMRSVLEEHAEELRDRTVALPPVATPAVDVEVGRLVSSHIGEVVTVVVRDVVDLERTVLRRLWSDLDNNALEAPTRWAGDETRTQLAAYWEHLSRDGIHASPPFGGPAPERARLVDAVWKESERFVAVLDAAVTDPGIFQLCGAQHLKLLEIEPDLATLIRFAPLAARRALDGQRGDSGAGPASERRPEPTNLVWTDGGQSAGVLRLARPRGGVVVTSLGDGS